jgi:pilus assembly protein CpaB
MRSGRLIMIVGVVFFLVALVGGALYLVNSRRPSGGGGGDAAQATPAPPANMTEIVVAAQSVIPRGTEITSENNAVKLATWPAESVPDGVLTALEDAYDRVARVDILLNMPVTRDMLTEEAGDLMAVGSDAALQIPPGRVAYALPVARWSSVAWALQPGDHVDVLLSFLLVDLDQEYQTVLPGTKVLCTYYQPPEGLLQFTCVDVPIGRSEPAEGGLLFEGPRGEQRPRLVTQMTVQDAIVLRVGDWDTKKAAPPVQQEQPQQVQQEGQPTPTPPPVEIRSLTVAVSPQDALVLKYAEETGTSMDLVLRSASDAGRPFTTESVTQQYIFDQYAIGAPPKLPYGITPPVVLVRPGMAGEQTESTVGVRAPGVLIGGIE